MTVALDNTEQAPKFFYSGSNRVALEREQGELICSRNNFRQALVTARPFRAQYTSEDDWEHDQEIFADTFKAFEKLTDWIMHREHRLKELSESSIKLVPHATEDSGADIKLHDDPSRE